MEIDEYEKKKKKLTKERKDKKKWLVKIRVCADSSTGLNQALFSEVDLINSMVAKSLQK